jgi:hypothetical protein
MIKQLDHDASQGRPVPGRYTLLHTNRTFEELAYHQELLAIEAAQRFDFVYVPSVSRPTARDQADPGMGRGRANNLLRHIFGMPVKEQDEIDALVARGEDAARAKAALAKVVMPALPGRISPGELIARFEPSTSVLLTCGNPSSMEDIKHVADTNRIPFEKEDW